MSEHATQLRRAPTGVSPPDPLLGSPLLEQMPGTSSHYLWHGERVHFRCMGEGPPLVLIHTPDVGASCLEWKRNIESLSATYTVFAPDLPGFGLSEARPSVYTAERYIRFVSEFIRNVVGPGTPAIGSVLGASYLVHAAARWPELVERLVLVAPAGLTSFRPGPMRGVTFQLLRLPLLSTAFYNSATSRYHILEHLQNDIYADERLAGPQAVDARYWVSHRPNALYVERSRMAGLMNVDIHSAVKRLQQPVLLIWGRRESRPPLADAELFRELNPNAMLSVFDRSGLYPHEEEPNRFNQAVTNFLSLDTFGVAVRA